METILERQPSTVRDRRLECLLLLAVLCVHGSFFHGSGWNQSARYATIFACVELGPEQGGLAINSFTVDTHDPLYTGDWSQNPERGPERYSNKPPGPALVGIPLYAVYRQVGLWWSPEDPPSRPLWGLNLLLTVLPVALSAPLFLRLLRSLGCGAQAALFWTLVLYFGSMAFPYSTQFWGHTTALAALVAALFWAMRGQIRALETGQAAGAATPIELMASGAFAALAVLSDNASVLIVGCLALWLALRDRQRVGYYLLGALPLAGVHLVYHQLLFGDALMPATIWANPDFSGPVGQAEAPELGRLFHLTLSPYRGLFFSMPVLLLAPWALRAGGLPRRLRWLSVGCVAALLVLNAGFFGWHGGGTVGPRYQIVALPLYVLLLAGLPWRGWLRRVAFVLATLGGVHMLVIACISPMLSTRGMASPLFFCYRLLYRWFREPNSSAERWWLPTHDFPGSWLGIPGAWALLPSLALFAVFAALLARRLQRAGGAASVGPGQTQ